MSVFSATTDAIEVPDSVSGTLKNRLSDGVEHGASPPTLTPGSLKTLFQDRSPSVQVINHIPYFNLKWGFLFNQISY